MLSSLSLGVKTKQYFVSSSDMLLNKKTFMIKRFRFFMRLHARIKADQVRTVFYFCSFYKTPWQLKIEFPNRQLSMTTFFPSFRENFLTFPRPLSAGKADKTTHK